VLLLLRQAPHYRLTPSALAEAAGVTRGTITGLLAGLERSGLVKRTEHPEDGRMFSIELTQQALDLFEQILPERFNHIGEFMSSLTEEDMNESVQRATHSSEMYRLCVATIANMWTRLGQGR